MRISVAKTCLCLAFLFPASVLQSQEADDLPEPAGAVLQSGRAPKPVEPLPANRQEVETSRDAVKRGFTRPRSLDLERQRQEQDLLTLQRAQVQRAQVQRAQEEAWIRTQQSRQKNKQSNTRFALPSSGLVGTPAVFDPINLTSRIVNSELAEANQVANESVSKLVQQIRSSKDSEEKDKLKAEIKEHLSTQYDAYLDHHEKPLKQLEERLEKLREEFDSRKKAKEDLVKLRLDTIWYEAIGLNWPATNSQSSDFSGPVRPRTFAAGHDFPTPRSTPRSMPTPPPKYGRN